MFLHGPREDLSPARMENFLLKSEKFVAFVRLVLQLPQQNRVQSREFSKVYLHF